MAKRIAGAALVVLFLSVAGVGGTLWARGYRAFIIHTGSMSPTMASGGLVIDRPAYGRVEPGQVITFRHSDLTSDVVTHRVVGLTNGLILTKGDANRTADPWQIRPSQVRGEVVTYIPFAGYASAYFKQPTGALSLLTALLGIALLWDLFLGAPFDTREEEPVPAPAGA
ncbi:signal peptidase I [Acidiferrimicrobium sp. IK]|uniref:signal peptidase I n=1 Tax=Acidiferrimicrobium sp. IK TaxID=2871700 RepID=UPI0021CB17CB|nr:signal peptidase I [Acidiferrimicrobium sp. IK]MCU4185709.1 signal peptidase I [Acidiferrimicrobium sp. IK]